MPGRWLLLLAATAGGGWLLDAAGLESPLLFAALLAGLASALLDRGDARPHIPAPLFTSAQAVLGVSLGTLLETSSLEAAAHAWAGVVLVSAGTLVICLAAGVALARWARADPPTAVLGMVAGGASGIVAMAGELGADDRVVAFMQYLRVLVVVLVTPIVAAVAFGTDGDGGGAPDTPLLGDAEGWLVVAVVAPAGLIMARAVKLTAGSLLAPLALAAALSLSDVLGTITVPGVLQDAAFVGIGLQVGLRFTPTAVREVGRLLLPTLAAIVALMVACFGLAAVLTATTDVPLLDAYLATTPGGLYAVLAAAFGSGADTTFILAVQTLRLFVMILLAPVLVRRIVGEVT